MKKFALVMVLAVLACSFGFAGPFGLEFGWTESELVNSGCEVFYSEDIVGGKLYVIEPSKPHSSFSGYGVMIDDVYGLYGISVLSDSIETSSRGTALTYEFDKIQSQIESVYGEAFLIDYLSSDSIWTEPGDFMYGLYYGDRYLMASWEDISDPSIDEIILRAEAESSTLGTISLVYYGSNYDAAIARQDEAEASVF